MTNNVTVSEDIIIVITRPTTENRPFPLYDPRLRGGTITDASCRATAKIGKSTDSQLSLFTKAIQDCLSVGKFPST